MCTYLFNLKLIKRAGVTTVMQGQLQSVEYHHGSGGSSHDNKEGTSLEARNNPNLGIWIERLAHFCLFSTENPWEIQLCPSEVFTQLFCHLPHTIAKSGQCLEGEVGCVFETHRLSLVFLYILITLRPRKFLLFLIESFASLPASLLSPNLGTIL